MSLRYQVKLGPTRWLRIPMWRRLHVACVLVMFNALGGCADESVNQMGNAPVATTGIVDPDPFYSGSFVVVNDSVRSITVRKWEYFLGEEPATGSFDPGTEKSSPFAGRDFPNLTAVSWVFEDDPGETLHSRVIDLTGLVPENTQGKTEFRFSDDGKWTVTFVADDGDE